MRQKSYISKRRKPLLYLPHRWVTVQLVRDHLALKMNIALFIRNLMLNIFLFDNFFEKKNSILWENCEKLFCGHIWQLFRERRRLALKINITFFITNELLNILLLNSFSKKAVIFWENGKKPFLGPKSLLKEIWAVTESKFVKL